MSSRASASSDEPPVGWAVPMNTMTVHRGGVLRDFLDTCSPLRESNRGDGLAQGFQGANVQAAPTQLSISTTPSDGEYNAELGSCSRKAYDSSWSGPRMSSI